MSCRSRKRQSELRLVRIRRLRSTATVSTKVRSGCSAIAAKICVANLSSGETLPPRGFAVALPVSRQRCTHFIAELALTSYSSAASRRDAPISTASITRSRSSLEQAFAIPPPPKGRINVQRLAHPRSFGNPPDSDRSGTALVSPPRPVYEILHFYSPGPPMAVPNSLTTPVTST